ncbi:DUF791-domain-containing protein [Xylariaceae sp. FL0016]|nr:DUF791-domain-containing protein [Xylariaceae sp. FL0016]
MGYYYQSCFAGLVVLCAILLASQPTRRAQLKGEKEKKQRSSSGNDGEHPEKYWYKAYALVMGADWLQGPYLYSLYKDEHGLSDGLVSTLFMTGFMSGAVSAYFVGAVSDKYGRKLVCMIYCVLYALSCFCTIIPSVPMLFLGRGLGGISTSILFSVFDSWMVTNFRERKLVEDGCDLSRTYATTSTINSLSAIMSGVVSELLVRFTGSRKSPFLLAAALLWLGLQVIWSHWMENFGAEAAVKKSEISKVSTNGKNAKDLDDQDKPKPASTVWSTITRPSILALGFASTMFEGSMYLFVFFWTPALKSVQKSPGEELPYGFIFASFMATAMAAALTFNIVTQRRLVKCSRLLVGVLLVANFSFVKLAGPKTEDAAFWLSCLFEAAVGMYWPCMGYLKGRLIEDDARAKVYGIMRVPLNVFVVGALMFVGDDTSHIRVFSGCSVLLTAGFAVMWAASMKVGMP